MKKMICRFAAIALPLALVLLIPFNRIHAQDMHVQDANSFYTTNTNADQDINTVIDFLQALIVDANFDKAKSMLTDDYMDYGPGYGDSVNTDQMIMMQQRTDSAESNWNIHYVATLSITVPSGELAGNWVFIWANVSSTDKPSGKTVTVPVHSVFRMQDGKIAFESDYFDNLSILREMGYTIKPPDRSSM